MLTAVSAEIQMEKALGLLKHLSFLFSYSLSDRFTKNLKKIYLIRWFQKCFDF